MGNNVILYNILPIQTGSGDPSPDNIRPIFPGLSLLRDDGTTLDVYGGTLDVTNGVLTAKHARKNLGELTWSSAVSPSLGDYFYARITDLDVKYEGDFGTTVYDAICDSYKTSKRAVGYFVNGCFTFDGSPSQSRVTTIQIINTDYSDPNDFATSLNGVYIVYLLATPLTYQLTPNELKRALISLGVSLSSLAESRRKIILNSPHIASGSGSIVTVNDAIKAKLKSCVVDINPVQSGTGDPSPDNIRPITGWTGVEIHIEGKNLFNIDSEDIKNGYYDLNGNYVPTTSFRNLTFDCKEGMKFTRSGDTWGGIITYWNGDTFISGENKASTITFTIPNGANKFRLAYPVSSSQLMLEIGDTANPYVPYNTNSNIRYISWQSEAGTVYGGTLDVTSGVLSVDRAIAALNGTESFLVTSGYIKTDACDAFFDIQNMQYLNTWQTSSFGLCNYLKAENQGIWNMVGYPNVFIFNKKQLHLNIANNIIGVEDPAQETTDSVAAKIKAWLKQLNDNGEPLTVIYPLATPLTYQLTPTQINTLLGTNNIWADTGDTSVEYWAHS